MKQKVTKRAVDALRRQAKARAKTLYCWDTELTGFGVWATKTAIVSFFIEYRMGGHGAPKARVTIGRYGPLTPDEARKIARDKLGQVARGIDVAQEKREEQRKLSSGTFAETAERYLALNGTNNKTWGETRRLIEHDVIPIFGNRPMVMISRGAVASLMDDVAQRSPSVARACFAAIRPLFRWALERGVIDHNPMFGLKAPAPIPSRKRVLSEVEVVAFWQASEKLGWPFGSVFRLLLITGLRRREVIEARWEEIDLAAAIWRISGERTKNKIDHQVDLSPQGHAILESSPRWGKSDLVFTTNGRTPPGGLSRAKGRLDTLMAGHLDGAMKPWRTHDLRRTVATMMGEELDIDQGVIERCLNHIGGTQSGLIGTYQRQAYRQKRKQAFLAWGAHIERLVNGKVPAANVVALDRARR